MPPDQLRELADALDRIARTHAMIAPDESETQHRAADYLRACADAQPAAWRCEVRGDGCVPKLGAVGWRHYHTTTSEREVLAFVTRCGNGIEGRAVPLYTHPAPAVPTIEERGPWSAGQDKQQAWEQRVWIESDDFAYDVRLYVNGNFESHDQRFAYAQEIARRLNAAPAAPQAEPKLGELMREQRNSRVVAGAYPDGNPNAGAMMAQTSQAEPKREPLSDDEILDILDIATAADLRFSMYSDDVETRAAIKRLARAVERAHGISGGSDAE